MSNPSSPSANPTLSGPCVLDASAVIAFLRDEPGADVVRQALDAQPLISAVNLAEVLTKLVDKGASHALAQQAVATLNLTVKELDAPAAHQVAWLRRSTRAQGLSLGDRACLALAAATQATVLTADRPWLALAADLALDIRSIRPAPH